jgi:phosphocarrier protein HPr
VYERNIVVNNPTGLHARPASILVGAAGKFKAKLTLQSNGKAINPRSMLNVLGAGIGKGTQITIAGEGEDEREAVDALCELIEKFAE